MVAVTSSSVDVPRSYSSPEERHARGAEKTEKFEQFGGALAFITGEKNSAKVKNDVFHRDKDSKKSNGAQHKIARNSVKPSDW